MVFINGKSVQFQTSHTFSWNPEFQTTSTLTKDTVGNQTKTLMTGYQWEVTTDNLMQWTGDTNNTDIAQGEDFISILQLGIQGTEVDLVFTTAGTFNPSTGWSQGTGSKLSGKQFVGTSSVQQDVSENSSFSIQFVGNGDLTVV